VCGISVDTSPDNVRKEIYGLNLKKDLMANLGDWIITELVYGPAYHNHCFEIKKACRKKRILILKDRKRIKWI